MRKNSKEQVYVYRHRRLDTNKIFYIGIGSDPKRPYSKYGRNTFWKRVVSKTDYEVEIIAILPIWELACELEELLIKEYGRRDLGLGNLCNLTNGGEGIRNPSLETRLKISESKKGKKLSKEHYTKLQEGRSKYTLPKETIKIIVQKNTGKKRTKEQCERISISLKGKISTPEARANRIKIRGRKVIDTSTNEVYDCIQDAATAMGIKYKLLQSWVSGKRINKSTIKYVEK